MTKKCHIFSGSNAHLPEFSDFSDFSDFSSHFGMILNFLELPVKNHCQCPPPLTLYPLGDGQATEPAVHQG